MAFRHLLVCLCAAAIAFVPSCGSGRADTTTTVKFRAGGESASYSGRVSGDGAARYVIDARGGQVMQVSLRAANTAAAFNVLPPGSGQAIFIGATEGNRFGASLPRTGRYVIEVYLIKAAARRNEAANFTLDIAIPASGAATRPETGGDYADGDAGGPDNWMVSGVPAGDRLSVRVSPSTSAALVARLRNGDIVRNRGCRRLGDSRWCRISVPGGTQGWANGRFLIEAGGGDDTGGDDRTVYDVKCRDSARDCIRKAENRCNGPFRTLDSESHAGGLLEDKVPGPVTWYYLEYQCGPSDGRPPRFPFRGARYDQDYGGNDYAMPLDERSMRDACRTAAAMAFGKNPDRVEVFPVERMGGGYSAYGQYPRDGRNESFVCSFNASGLFKHVYRQ